MPGRHPKGGGCGGCGLRRSDPGSDTNDAGVFWAAKAGIITASGALNGPK